MKDGSGERRPRLGTIRPNQSRRLMAPVHPGDGVRAGSAVRAIDHRKLRVTLDCHRAVGDTVGLKGAAPATAPGRNFD